MKSISSLYLIVWLLCVAPNIAQSQLVVARVMNHDTAFTVYRAPTEEQYIVAAALQHSTRVLYLLSRYGSVVDSMRLAQEDYLAVKQGLATPFEYCRMLYESMIRVGRIATEQLARTGKIDERWEYAALMTDFIDLPASSESAFTKLAIVDEFTNHYLYARWLLDCPDPRTLPEDSALLTNDALPPAGSMINGRDSIFYYNKNTLAWIYKATLVKKRALIYYYDKDQKKVDSLAIHAETAEKLQRNKTDVFLYYRCLLAIQQQATLSTIYWLEKARREHPFALVQFSEDERYNPALVIAGLEKQLHRLDTAIHFAAYPSTTMMATVVRKYYYSTPDYTPLLSMLGMSYNLVSTRGNKMYELADQRGNVMAAISDKKIAFSNNGNTVDFYQADVLSASDYYSFGMVSRSAKAPTSASYRYGFNGKENDNEVKGDGNQYDYGFRIYDPRLGRFLSVDPLFKGYPWYTPYQFAGNMPVWAIDLDGLEEMKANSVANVIKDVKGNIVTKTTVVNDPSSSADAIPGVKRLNPGQIEVTPGLIEGSHPNWNTFTWQQVNGKDFYVGQTNTPIGKDAGGTPPKTNLQQDNDGDRDRANTGTTPTITPFNNTQVQNQTLTRNINFVPGHPEFATTADEQMVNQVATSAPNSTTTGRPVTTTNGNTTTTTTTIRQVRSIITIDLMTSNPQNLIFGGTNAPQLQTDRYNTLKKQLMDRGVPGRNIRRGRTQFGVPNAQMGGNVNQTIFRIRTTRSSSTTGTSTTTD